MGGHASQERGKEREGERRGMGQNPAPSTRGGAMGAIEIPLLIRMGRYGCEIKIPPPLREAARWERSRSRPQSSPAVGASISSVVPARSGFFGRSRGPLTREGDRGGATGAGSGPRALYPLGRDGGDIKAPSPVGAIPLLAHLSPLLFHRVQVFQGRLIYPFAQEGERGGAPVAGSKNSAKWKERRPIGLGRYAGGGFVLPYLCLALGVGLGRYRKSQKALEPPN